MRAAAALCLSAALPFGAALAQQGNPVRVLPGGEQLAQGIPQSPVLTLDQDRLFRQSLFGQRVLADLEAETKALSAENRRIEGELAKEEKELTVRRETMPPAEFNKLADAFDKRVVGIRAAQDAKARAISQISDKGQQAFFERAFPVLAEVVRQTGAFAILDSRAIVISANTIDITDQAIQRVDLVLGDGTPTITMEDPGAVDAPAAPEAPAAAPQTPVDGPVGGPAGGAVGGGVGGAPDRAPAGGGADAAPVLPDAPAAPAPQ
ncbi:OmpH family outer membrane protein [Brevirhabdus sp.]|uniref:OmpH family outer membrane protein n=1 Tax=Brevirhabdus sp. TaxID=2004514 RepID=UPI004057FF45